MRDFFRHIFDTSDFPARWRCGHWTSAHGYLHIVSDLMIFGAYVAIPVVLAVFVWHRRDVPFYRLFWLFVVLIFACGTTHMLEAVIFYWPVYRLAGVLKLITAVVSWVTAFAMLPALPKALAMPGLARVNDQLQCEILQRQAAERQLRELNHGLENAVAAKVQDLRRSEEHLHLAQQAARLGNWELHPARGEFVCSPELLSLYGWESRSTIFTVVRWLELIHPEDVSRVRRDLERALHEDEIYESEFRIMRPDGEVRYLLGQGRMQPHSKADSEEKTLLGVHLDITPRKRLEEAIAIQIDCEKQRISQELHDDLGQQITGMGLLSKGLQRALDQDGSEHAVKAAELTAMVPRMIHNLRRVVRGLMPVEVDSIGLMSALEQLTSEIGERSGIAARLICPHPVEFQNTDAALQLYRIAQEAANNAVKHSHAKTLEIRLQQSNGLLTLEIADNGTGLPTPAASRSGMGLKILQHRATQLGANLTIESERNHGTIIRCVWTIQSTESHSCIALETPDRG